MDKLIYLVPGFISYIALRPFGLFNFQSDTDRQLTLIILSLINSGISTTLSSYLWNNSIIAIFVSAIIITIIYFWLFTAYNKFSQTIANKLNMNLYDNMGTMEHSLSQNYKTKDQFLISFDFDNNYIASGQVKKCWWPRKSTSRIIWYQWASIYHWRGTINVWGKWFEFYYCRLQK